LDDARLEAILEEVADPLVASVETLGVEKVEPVHAGRQREPLGFDDEVEVVVHQAEDVAEPSKTARDLGQLSGEEPPVDVVAHDRDLSGPALRYVVDPVRQ
jgi:hypothetical protein